DNVTFHVGNLPGAELGYELPGQVWIDQTAAGWGWSTTGDPNRMDLRTVVEHELGHALGFDHADAGAMEPTLAPGLQLVPEAPGVSNAVPGALAVNSGTGAGATTAGAAVSAPTPSLTASTPAVVTGVSGGVALPAAAEPGGAGSPAGVSPTLASQG